MTYCENDIVSLSEKDNSNIIKCRCCNKFQLSFKNIVMNMQKKELIHFKKILDSYELYDSDDKTSNSKEVIIRCMDVQNICFSFDKEEVEELKDLFSEALFMDDVYCSVGGKSSLKT